ncbi:DUF4373 domain-containing protein [Bacillus mesophilum]|uniref:DUF4373 domain-containing protein n=1 Tax=Bacillus mesophilum TaxID=1071718 RepID=A0A7V7RNZ0_9BACI|nr:DUF4373 domain-containing protein [Bacillus mesophilum]KAB2334290.1 DUF4373 domain-containing protein [Bacillus mesophilum]
MARPTKEGLDYFPLDVDMDQDDKVALIEAQHGVTGFAIVVKLFMKIYKNGYFYNWTEKEQLLFSRIINVDINSVIEVVNDCIKWGLFSDEMYENHAILTSNGIQKRYLEAASRRQKVKIPSDHLLLSPSQVDEYKNLIIEGVNDDINNYSDGVNDNTGTQSKVKESKVKKSKEKKSNKDINLEIENFRQRYSENQLKIIDNYLEMIRHTRRSAKIADTVIFQMYDSWDKYPEICVEYGLKTHTDNPSHHSKGEKYTLGIIRGTTAEEAFKKLGSSNQSNSLDFNQYV